MAPVLSPVTDPVWLGEGPHWDHGAQALYFVSIFDGTLHKLVDGSHYKAKLDGMPTFVIPIEGKPNHFAVGLNRKVVEVEWEGGDGNAKVKRTIAEVDKEHPNNRFNDAKADPRGRLFAGTMGHEYEPGKFNLKMGSLYRFEEDGTPQKLVDGIDISNGLCWDVANKAFYFIDSFEYTIRRYDYDIETGEIANPRTVFSMAEHNKHLGKDEKNLTGIFDGMTIDTQGNLWVANFDGYQVLKIDPKNGKLLQTIRIPALQTTSVTFGGPELDILYVTTASMNRGEEQRPPAGATFKIEGTGSKGYPNNYVRFVN
ncbi:hypothetical protein PYW08_003477 [Mythimna loreyi]|uniref:Uncharacterized protein n=1 Tax=Mythimna loreyi TaxID=667449 RepID=A0ACC2QVH8_9NEOP|nr:hypothetical protein PYW08_003477 [Mythimna loreyi]